MAGTALAQTSDPTTQPEPDVQPRAIEALEAMAPYLRGLEQFRLTAHATSDDVLDGDLKVQVGSVSTFEVLMPDRMKLEVKSDQQWRIYYYDGATVTQYAPALSLYSVYDGAPTIAETLQLGEEKYGVELPLADLFFWGTERSNIDELTIAYFVGEAQIGGRTCSHYAFRAREADFQVWIAKRGDPLPCRLVITTTTDPTRPEYEATLTWDLDPLLTDSLFSFAPAEGVTEVKQVEFVAEESEGVQ